MQVTQYRPAFFEGFENQVCHVHTTEELLAIPFVKGFAEEEQFFGYACDDTHLMALYDGGYKWWVVAFLESEEGDSIVLDEFVPRYRAPKP